jgi:hypothetical protein
MSGEERIYNATVRMIGELHGFERGFWREHWVNELHPENGEVLLKRLKDAHHHVCQLRNAINHFTLVGEPEELELEDDGESHLRGMEAFASGGMDAFNEAQGYGVVSDGPDCGHHCPGCSYCRDVDPHKHD